jgi:phosphatidylinositol alpha-1,6-mannosyltransferase
MGKLIVIGPSGCRVSLPSSVTVDELAVQPLPLFLLRAAWRALIRAIGSRPRVIVAGSGLAAPIAVITARLRGARSVVYLHGLDLVVDHSVYRLLWLPWIRRCDTCIANSASTLQLAIDAGVRPSRLKVVHPGVTLPDDISTLHCEEFRQSMGWEGRKVMLSVGRLTQRKGLVEFVQDVLPLIVARYPGVLLVVIGDDAPDALAGGRSNVRARVIAISERLGLSGNIHLLGPCDESTLKLSLATADVHVFPVRAVAGDVEGFGMVAIEAAAHGLPTIAYAVGGVPDAVEDGVSGWLVEAGDEVGFSNRIIETLADGRKAWDGGARRFAAAFSWDNFGRKFRETIA